MGKVSSIIFDNNILDNFIRYLTKDKIRFNAIDTFLHTDPKVKDAMNQNNWDYVFELFSLSTNLIPAILVSILLKCDIDFLPYMTYLPASFIIPNFLGVTEIKIPKNIKLIDRHAFRNIHYNAIVVSFLDIYYEGTEDEWRENVHIKNTGGQITSVPALVTGVFPGVRYITFNH